MFANPLCLKRAVLLSCFSGLVSLMSLPSYANEKFAMIAEGPSYSDNEWEQAFEPKHIEAILTDRSLTIDDLVVIEDFAKCVVKKDSKRAAEFAKMPFASMAQSQFFVSKVIDGRLSQCITQSRLELKPGMAPVFIASELWAKTNKGKPVPISMSGRNPVENYALCFLYHYPKDAILEIWSNEIVGDARARFIAEKANIDPACADKLGNKAIDPNSLLYALQTVTYNNFVLGAQGTK